MVFSSGFVGGGFEFAAVDAFVEFLLMRLHDFLHLAHQLYLRFFCLGDDFAQTLRVVLLSSIGESQL